MMRLGVDFDNTIACYNTAFHRAAVSRGLLPETPGLSKSQVRDTLRKQGREEDWIALQGYVYGPGMKEVETFPGVAECLRSLGRAGVEVFVISHKTRRPFRGPAWDLHEAAHGWLEQQGFFDPQRIGLERRRVFFELTLGEKLARIAEQRCTHFLDDLPEVLGEAGFPAGTTKFLFDPEDAYPGEPHVRVRSWAELATCMRGQR
jgi:hypothetical protein